MFWRNNLLFLRSLIVLVGSTGFLSVGSELITICKKQASSLPLKGVRVAIISSVIFTQFALKMKLIFLCLLLYIFMFSLLFIIAVARAQLVTCKFGMSKTQWLILRSKSKHLLPFTLWFGGLCKCKSESPVGLDWLFLILWHMDKRCKSLFYSFCLHLHELLHLSQLFLWSALFRRDELKEERCALD